ncbi:MAG: PIN domain-containing protein [Pirellulales bacterium]|nr:PIN domain-containing protein [Pirellulales bacterium]
MIFIDAGAIIARLIARDQNHNAAIEFRHELSASAVSCCTSNLVMGEALTLIARRTSPAEQAFELYSSKVLRIIRSTEADEISAISLLTKYADQQVGFVDCVSFALMRRLRIFQAFTFDRHFATAGFVKP